MPTEKASPENPDDVLQSLQLLSQEAKSSFDSFKKKALDRSLDAVGLASEMEDLFSIVTDLAQLTFQAHNDHFEWAAEVDEDMDALKAELGSSTLLPEDAEKLKTVITALVENLRAPTSAADDVPARLKLLADEALAFIDDATAEEDPEADGEEATTN